MVFGVAGDRLELDCHLSPERMPGIAADAPLRLALSIVVKDAEGDLSCRALTQPSEKPDFYYPASFILELGPPPKEGMIAILGGGR
jgi:hypothetical protein